ncbi:SdrD B-like domain-containing protein [Rudanella paleaurantiibacter]|nr:SdrD B-like domain-containing protein [Rudanella paleaurantiibacter]
MVNLIQSCWLVCCQGLGMSADRRAVRWWSHRDGQVPLPAKIVQLRKQTTTQWAFLSALMLSFGLLSSLGASAQAPSGNVDLSVSASISNAAPQVGSPLTYTIAVANSSTVTASNVRVKVTIPAGYITVNSFTASTGASSFSAATGDWTIASLPGNTTATVLISATSLERGVAFTTAEVIGADQSDVDSVPNNGSYLEDDIDNVCFSIPLLFYAGDEYEVSAPASFSGVRFFRNGAEVGTAAVSSDLASVDANGNLLIKSVGVYSLVASLSGCQAGNCCDIIVEPGPLASLGNYVWLDNNRDGQQGPTNLEPPVAGVTVQLFQPGSTSAVSTTVTDANGSYLFANLVPGEYYVVFTPPANFTFTTANSTSPISGTGADAVDSDADVLIGRTQTYTLVGGESNLTVDAGLLPLPASLGDFVWSDTNGNGQQDPGEPGVQGVVVTLYQPGTSTPVGSATTTATGAYSFTGLTPGDYYVVFTAPQGTTFTTSNTGSDLTDSDIASTTGLLGSTGVISLTAGENNPTIDAGLVPLLASLGDYVWIDSNGNGQQDAGETGVPNVTVQLFTAAGTPVASTTTNTSGLYSFTGLTAGSYYVVFTAPQGTTFTTANTGSDLTDSDVASTTGLLGSAGIVSLTAGENNPTIDAGLIPLKASLGNYVWFDANKNGQQDPTETGVSNVTVTLYSSLSAAPLATQVTSASGTYLFTNLDAGDYYVVFTAPGGFTFTTANVGSDVTDSDAQSFTGQSGSTGVYSLSAGEQNLTVDAGIIPLPASLGDFVWLDTNRNGVQDPGEPGYPGVEVTLYDAISGTVVSTTVTSASGLYAFTNLPAGEYYVTFTAPQGTTFTTSNATTDNLDSDIESLSGLIGRTGTYTLVAGQNNPTVDAGLVPLLASLGDYVWIDSNGDGQQGPAGVEPPVANVVVTLYQPGNPTPVGSTTTNTSGFYSFTGLTAGDYYVVFAAPQGTTFTTANTGSDLTDSDVASTTGLLGSTGIVSLTAGENNPTIDAGLIPLKASLGNYVWFDANKNGQQDPTETGVSNVTVTLYSSLSAAPLATQVTSASGTYLFTNLDAGDYYVVFTAPGGFTFTTANVGSDVTDSDAQSFTGQSGSTGVYSLSAGEQNLTVDAGIIPLPASLGDFVWSDTNGNGQQDPGEPGVQGVVVTLYQPGTSTPVGSATTTATGAYSFTGLTPGDYYVVFTAPQGSTFTTPNTGSDATDSDVASTTGLLGSTGVISLTAGENNPTVDAGLVPLLASLGDYVWIDSNGNGQQDAGETGVPNVAVQLFTATGTPVGSTTTNTSGFYSFTGLTAGSYYVVFTAPQGTTFTTANTGSDLTDSDVASMTGLLGSTGIVSLTAGENNPTIDAGLIPLKASLGNYVWFDANKNGQQDPTETGVSNVTVTLYSSLSAAPLATQVTSASGTYLFTNLDAGDYYVVFTAPGGFTFTTANVGSDVTDSDAQSFTGQSGSTGVYSLSAGEQNLTVDAGIIPLPASLGDFVWSDTNGNGQQDPGEPGVQGVVVTLYQPGTSTPVGSATTTATGAYSFTGLTPGDYYVVFTAPQGSTFTTPNTGSDLTDSDVASTTGLLGSTGIVSLTAGQVNNTVDAGLVPLLASLGDYVWIDSNGNGQQDAGETGVPNVTVQLFTAAGTPVASTTTNTSGLYSFTGLTAGSYYVVFTAPQGTTFTTANTGSDLTDSDVASMTGLLGSTGIVSLTAGENNPTIDAGLIPLKASLGNYVWFDANKNGQQDPTETGVSNVTVTLYSSLSAAPLATQVTSASGTYLFTNLDAGDYYVVFTAPGGFTFTTANVGSDVTDSDAQSFTGQSGSTGVYSLSAGEQNLTVDAGIIPLPASLGDFVWSDTNGNGQQDPGEPGVQGVVVTLYQPGTSTPVGSATTTATGAYSFTGLTPGDYYVVFTAPQGSTFTTPNTGSDATDSDVASTTGLLGSTGVISLTAGENNPTVDAGLVPLLASLGDYVWIDSNGNGQQDAGETGVPNVAVQLFTATGTPVGSTTTNTSGFYSFTGLTAGSYYVVFTAPQGTTFTTANTGSDLTDSDVASMTGLLGSTGIVSLTAGENNPTIDAGLIPLKASLGNYVWFDANKNGQQDPTETGVSNVTVTLYSSLSAAPLATQVTSASGTYLFTNLDAGDYYVVFTAPGGFTFTTANVGSDVTDSDAQSFTGQSGSTGVYSLSAGEQNLTVDAGIIPLPASLGDFVWLDTNRNGVQDPGEPGVQGVVVTLYQPGTSTPVGSATTTATGAYSFTGLTPGDYYVVFTAPQGLTFATPNTGSDATDSDVASTTGLLGSTGVISLTAGQVNNTVDAGLTPLPASLGDFVWSDTNGNGQQDPGEPGVPNVVVTLYQPGNPNPVATTSTNVSGLYSFTGLMPGNYYVVFTAPVGSTFTAPLAGTNTATDSNVSSLTGQLGATGVISLTAGQVNNTVDAGLIPACPSTPIAPVVVASSTTICEGGVVTLTASSPGAAGINWYLTPNGSNGLLGTVANGASFTVSPTTTTVYYAEIVSTTNTACPTARTPFAIEVTRKPPTPTCPERLTVCTSGGTVNLTKVYSSTTTGTNVFEWRTGIDPMTSTLVTNLTAVGPGKYYLFERSLNGCYSNPSILTVEGVSCECPNPPTIALGPGRSICEGEKVVLIATIGGGASSVSWTTTGSGTLVTAGLSATYTPSAMDADNGLVTISARTNDPDGAGVCLPASTNIVIDINERPDAPVGVACDDTLVCQGQSTKLIGFSAQGARINWYDAQNNFLGQTASAGKLTITPTATSVYYAEAVTEEGCVSGTRTALTVVVGQCKADLAVSATLTPGGSYSVGQTVTYVVTACNNGPVTGQNAVVNFPLPTSVSYVSASPSVGTYNPATGSWSIGNMAVGECRNLFVEVVITGSGPISATAVITGTNDDQTKLQNNTATVTIPVIQCNVQPPHIVCALTQICVGEATTLIANQCSGNVIWSNGQTGASITVRPTTTTTYTATCVVGSCRSSASNPLTVTVNNPTAPTILASAGTVCAGGTVSLTAVGCEGGTVLWSTGATGSVISTVINERTTITANCRIANCLSPEAQKVIELGGDLPKPTVICSTSVVCPGESLELTVQNCLGTPLWSTGQTGASITVQPTVGNNTYFVTCTNGACRSPKSDNYTIQIVAPAVPTVTLSSASVCAGGSVTLTASGCANGTIQWSNQRTGNSIVVNPTTNISYFAVCKVRECLSEPSAPATIQIVNPTAPIVRRPSKPIICSGESVTLVADGCAAGTIVWSNGATGSSIVVMPTTTTTYSASCQIGTCRSASSNGEMVTVNTNNGTPPTIAASKTTTCGNEPISLTATGCTSGTVVWSTGQIGNIISVTPMAQMNEFYAVCREGSACGTPRSNTIRVTITPMPTPTVVCSESVICPGESVILEVVNCAGTPRWSTGQTTTSITVSPTVTTGYSVTCQNGACVSASSPVYSITVVKPTAPTITASATAVQPGTSVTLTASCPAGSVLWSNNATTTSIVVSASGTQSYQAFCKYRQCLSDPSNTITIVTSQTCAASAGTLTAQSGTVCAGTANSVVVAATPNGNQVVPAGYSTLYVLTKGTDLVIQATSPTPSFTVASENANYRVHTLVYNATSGTPNFLDLSVVRPGVTKAAEVLSLIAQNRICASLDAAGAPVAVQVVAPPVINGSSTTVCAGASVTYTASGCENGTVTWSNGMTGQTIVVAPVVQTVWLMATCTINGCTSKESHSFDTEVVVPQPPVVTCNKPVICAGEQTTLEATGCTGGQYEWSNGMKGASIVVTPTATDHVYRVKCIRGACVSDWSPSCTITVGGPNAPTISIQTSGTTTVTSASICFGSPITLVATGCPAGAYAIWSNEQVGNSITVTPARNVVYTAQCCTSNNCKSAASNPVTISVGGKVVPPTTKDLTNACPFTSVNLAQGVVSTASTQGGVFEFYTSATPSAATRVANPGAVSTSGVYYAFEKTTAGCYSLGSVINVGIVACEGQQIPCAENPLTADAGRDDKICAAKTYKLNGKATGNGIAIQWTSNGTGKFSDPFSAAPTYTPSLADVQAGKVTLTMTVRTGNSTCVPATDAMVLTIEGVKEVPTIAVLGSTNLCYGDSVVLQASAGSSYLWSNKATTNRIVVKQSGVYSVQVFDAAGCSSLMSESVSVTVGTQLPAPLVTNKRNICPATTVDLTTALSETATAGVSYAFRTGPLVTSGLVMRPDAVTDGTYYAFKTNAAGCVSAPAAIEVKTFNCAADTNRADLAITKVASKSALNRGEVVTYTITVENKGPKAATNVTVRDVIPTGLELLPGDYNVSNGAVTKWYGVLAANATQTLTIQARATQKGAIVNTAEITYADQTDPNLANNKSSATVADTSAVRPGMIGLAKSLVSQKMLTDSTFEVEYAFRLRNYGDSDLTNVQVTDDLKAVFGTHTIQDVSVATTDANNFNLTFNPAFRTGDSKVFDGKGTLKASATTYFFVSAKVKIDPNNSNRTFSNTAMASAMANGMITEDASVDGADADPDGDGNPNNNASATVFTLQNLPTTPVTPIGVALAAVSTVKQPDNSYNVTYKVTVKNFGEKELVNVSLTDSLAKSFAPATFSVVSGPTTRSGSNLLANTGFNGSTNVNLILPDSKLAVGEMDSVMITINVTPNGNNGPFYSQVIGSATIASTTLTVTDLSNNGVNPAPAGELKTPVRFDLPDALLGVAKSVGTPVMVEEGVFDVPYTIKLSNLGTADLTKVQVVDNLANTFNRGALILSNRIRPTADAGLAVDSLYTGQGLMTKMLVDTLSTLPKGTSRSLNFVVRVNVKNADSLTFYNSAVATARTQAGEMVADTSTAGANPDPMNTLDPRTSNTPTPVILNSVPNRSFIGIALAVKDTLLKEDGSYDVVYEAVVRNFGTVTLTNVTITDTLSKVFNEQTGASFRVIGTPIVSATSGLKPNPAFNGDSDVRLVLPESSTLGAGRTDTLRFVVNVRSNGLTTTFLNTAYASALSNTMTVTDISTNGLNPDVNGNRNPTDSMEGEATPLSLRVTDSAIFIPEGFSPNGDNINDVFVIRGAQNQTVSLEVFNRWGHVVYKNDDYKNDWDGTSNTGIRTGGNTGLPDGTYFYRVKLENGRTYVRYMTINR